MLAKLRGTTLTGLVLTAVLAALAGCGGSSGATGDATPTAAPVTLGAQGCVPATTDGRGGPYPAAVSSDCRQRAAIEIDVVSDPKSNGGFSPSNVTISAGTKVTFVWKSSGHNLSPFHDDIEDSGYRFSMTFAKAGEFDYQCQVHPGQNGVIYVR